MKSILKALAQFQREVKGLKKSDDNPFFKSKYASLDAIQQHIKPALTNAGLVVTQSGIVIEGSPFVQTRVWEAESGEYVESLFPIVVQKHTSQDYGSAVSYAKRYSITGLLNLIIQDEDDDGNVASGKSFSTQASTGRNDITIKKPELSTPTNDLPLLNEEKKAAMIDFIEKGKFKEVESAMSKYFIEPDDKQLLLSKLNTAKASAIKSNTKK